MTVPDRDEQSADYELLLPSEDPGSARLKLPTDRDMGQEEQVLKPEGRRGDTIARYSALTAACVLVLVTWIIVLKNNPSALGWFVLHPLLQTLAMSFFTFGILTLQPTSQPRTKATGLVRHQLAIFMLGFPAILVGTLSVMYNKYVHEAKHFVSWHGTFGIICMAWILIQVAVGGGSVWFGGAAFGGGAKAKAIWKYHRLSGYILFPMLLLTTHLGGAWSHWGAKNAPYGTRLVTYTIAPAVILASIYARVRLSKMKFF